jgi:hypothetical protein
MIDPVFREHYAPGSLEGRYGEEQEGEDIATILQEMVGDIPFQKELIEGLIDCDEYWPPDGGEPFYGTDINYERIYRRGSFSVEEWRSLQDQIKYRRRYFSDDAKRLFDALFANLETEKAYDGNGIVSPLKTLIIGQEIWRARLCSDPNELQRCLLSPSEELGPPPKGKARAGRMNAQGVSVFYGALDEKTCIAEMRPSIGARTVVGRFRITQPVRMLDFSLLERVWGELSYFEPNFRENRDKATFLRRLHDWISFPVPPGREEDYFTTQALAEYLAHVCPVALDGLLFRSTQRVGGVNVVLFCDAIGSEQEWDWERISERQVNPFCYVEKSAKIFSTSEIKYRNNSVSYSQYGDKVWIHADDDP